MPFWGQLHSFVWNWKTCSFRALMDVLVISYLRVFSGCNQTWNIALSAHKGTAASLSDLLSQRTQLSAVWCFVAIIMCNSIKTALSAVVASHFYVLLLLVFTFLGRLSGCKPFITCIQGRCISSPSAASSKSSFSTSCKISPNSNKTFYFILFYLATDENLIPICCLSLSFLLQVTICQVNRPRLPSHQLRPHTGSTRPSPRWAAARWPIKGARVHPPQPAWRLTCRVQRNASSCRTAGCWAAMWLWRAGERAAETHCEHLSPGVILTDTKTISGPSIRLFYFKTWT